VLICLSHVIVSTDSIMSSLPVLISACAGSAKNKMPVDVMCLCVMSRHLRQNIGAPDCDLAVMQILLACARLSVDVPLAKRIDRFQWLAGTLYAVQHLNMARAWAI